MTEKQICKLLSEETGFYRDDARVFLKAFSYILKEEVYRKNQPLTIFGLGRFYKTPGGRPSFRMTKHKPKDI